MNFDGLFHNVEEEHDEMAAFYDAIHLPDILNTRRARLPSITDLFRDGIEDEWLGSDLSISDELSPLMTAVSPRIETEQQAVYSSQEKSSREFGHDSCVGSDNAVQTRLPEWVSAESDGADDSGIHSASESENEYRSDSDERVALETNNDDPTPLLATRFYEDGGERVRGAAEHTRRTEADARNRSAENQRLGCLSQRTTPGCMLEVNGLSKGDISMQGGICRGRSGPHKNENTSSESSVSSGADSTGSKVATLVEEDPDIQEGPGLLPDHVNNFSKVKQTNVVLYGRGFKGKVVNGPTLPSYAKDVFRYFKSDDDERQTPVPDSNRGVTSPSPPIRKLKAPGNHQYMGEPSFTPAPFRESMALRSLVPSQRRPVRVLEPLGTGLVTRAGHIMKKRPVVWLRLRLARARNFLQAASRNDEVDRAVGEVKKVSTPSSSETDRGLCGEDGGERLVLTNNVSPSQSGRVERGVSRGRVEKRKGGKRKTSGGNMNET